MPEYEPIYEVRVYVNDKNMMIKVHTPIMDAGVGESGNLFSKSRISNDGRGQKITATVGAKTPTGVQPLEITFPEEYSIREAFEHFDDEAKKAHAKFMEAVRAAAEAHAKAEQAKKDGIPPEKSRIIVPNNFVPNPRKAE